ncbi:MAG: Ppx/GppA family phosphatase [Phycisphaerales bacterium]|nr:Ppx/GppA family phosphatase [Phycisphaerales bacterium]
MKPRRFSVIDIGTNSARFLAAELLGDGSWKPIADRREPCRLGEGLAAGNRLGDVPMQRAIAAVAAFVAASREVRAPIVRAVATHAVRWAENRDEFLGLLRKNTGVELVTIPPRVEGRLSYRAVADLERAADRERLERVGVLDTGGGSVQFTVGVGDVPMASVSMPLGAVALTERFGGTEACAGERFDEMREHIARHVESALDGLPIGGARIFGVGGGCVSAGELCRQRAAGTLSPGNPGVERLSKPRFDVTLAEVRDVLKLIRPMSAAERAALPGMAVERSQIMVAGLAVIEAILSRASPHAMTTLTVGLRDGLVVEAAEMVRIRAAARATTQKLMLPAAAAAFAQRSRAEQPHSSHVAALAMRLHAELVRCARASQIRKGRWCRRRSAAILHAAALVHDTGIAISYKGHHKHSETLVTFNGLPGVKPGIAELVAATARYHRRACPSKKHAVYGSLDKKDRRLVRMLGGILRVADGLDRSHRQVVTDVRASVQEDQLRVVAISADEPTAELAAAIKKSDLLVKAAGRPVSVAWQAASPAS